MIEAYKIAANLTLTGDAHLKMAQFAKNTTNAAKAMEKLLSSMKPFNTEFMKFADIMTPLNQEFSAFNASITSTSRRLTTVSNNAATARSQLNMLATAAGRVTQNLGVSSAVGSTAIAKKRGHSILPHAGTVGVFAAMAAGSTLASGFHQGTEYQNYVTQLKSKGMTSAEVNQAINFTSTAKAGVSQNKQMESFIAAYMATQSIPMAYTLAPKLQKAQIAAQAYGGLTFSGQQDLTRFAEVISGGQADKMPAALDTAFQLFNLSGGSIKPNELRGFYARSPLLVAHLSKMGLLGLEPLMQELRPTIVGTGLRTGAGFFAKGTGLNKVTAPYWQKAGLLKSVKYGKMDQVTGGAFSNEFVDQYYTDPELLYFKTIRPALLKEGITKSNDIQKWLQRALPPTTANVFGAIEKSKEKIMRERGIIPGLKPIEVTAADYMKSESGAMYRFTESFKSFSKSLNDVASPGVIATLNAFSFVFEKMANISQKNKQMDDTVSPILKDAFLSRFNMQKNLLSSAWDGVTSHFSGGHQQQQGATLVVDGYALGRVSAKNLFWGSNPLVDHGQSSVNSPFSPISIGTPNIGGPY